MINYPSKIDIGKFESNLNNKIIFQNILTNCIICGKDIKSKSQSFHKSHSISHFVLKNIKYNYKGNDSILTPSYILNNNITPIKESIGINKAGIFYCICSECDQTLFKNYENEEFLLTKDPKEIIDSIALKTAISDFYISLMKLTKLDIDFSELTDNQIIQNFSKVKNRLNSRIVEFDITDYVNDIKFAFNSCSNKYHNYEIIYHKILNYTVPIAAQLSIPVIYNVDYSELQSINDRKIEDLLLAIFPLKEKSVIILYYKKGNKKI